MIYLILALALGLRLTALNQSLWLDEATSALVARDYSWQQIFTKFLPGDFHPPVYYVLLKLWAQIFGTSEIGLRLLSVAAGLASVWLVYRLTKSSLAALFLATSGLHLYFSQEVRMYVLASFFVTLAVYFFVKTQKEGRVGQWLGFGLTLAAATLTHYLALLMLPVFWLKAKKNFRFLMSHNILVVAWLTWLPVFRSQLTGGLGIKNTSPSWWQILGKTSVKEFLLIPVKFGLGRISFDSRPVYILVAGLVTLLFGLVLVKAWSRPKKDRLLWLWLVVPVTIAAGIGFFLPVFSYFRLLFVLPAFYLLLAQGALSFKKVKVKALVVSLILLVNLISSGIYLFDSKFHREDWRGLVGFVEALKTEASLTLFVRPSQMEAYHYYAPQARTSGPENLNDEFDTIWLMRYVQEIFDSQDQVRGRVEVLGYQKTGEYDFNGVVVWRYER